MLRDLFAVFPIGAVAIVTCGGTVAPPLHGCAHLTAAVGSFESRCNRRSPVWIAPSESAGRPVDRVVRACELHYFAPGSTMTAVDVDACASALETVPCDATRMLDTLPCARPGSVPVGGPCVNGLECESASCTQEDSGRCGACVATLPEDAPCDPNAGPKCGFGLVCNATGACMKPSYNPDRSVCDAHGVRCDDNLYCLYQPANRMSACVHYSGLGGECWLVPCAPPLVCVPTVGLTCVAALKAGEPCMTDSQCEWDLLCDRDTYTCKPPTYPTGEGASCNPYGGLCKGGGYCIPKMSNPGGLGPLYGVCPKIIADGQPCDSVGPGTTCDYGAHCIGGTCQFANACE